MLIPGSHAPAGNSVSTRGQQENMKYPFKFDQDQFDEDQEDVNIQQVCVEFTRKMEDV